MKKILSAVLMILTIMAAATLTGSVLAADPYVYTPDDGLQVVYVSNSGTVNSSVAGAVEVTTLSEAVGKLGKNGGYVVLLEDIDIGRSASIPGGSNGAVVTYRGRTDGDTPTKMKGRYMCSAAGDMKFEDIDLHWYAVDSKDNDQSLRCGNRNVTIGENVITSGTGITLTGVNLSVYSGKFHIRFGEYNQKVSYGSVNITIGGTAQVSVAATHAVATSETTVNGDVNVNISGGTYSGKMTNPGKFIVNGNFNVNVSGGTISSEISTSERLTLNGLAIVNLLDFPAGAEKTAMANKINKGAFALVLTDAVHVSANGNDDNAGTVAAPLASFDAAVKALGSAGGVVMIDDTVTIDGLVESARTSTIVVMGKDDDSALVINGDYEIGGTTIFKDVVIENGADGAIVAGGKNLNIMSDVKTAANAEGRYIDIVAGKRGELIVVNVTVDAGTYQNIIPAGLAGSKVTVASKVNTIESGVSADVVYNALNISKSKIVENAVITISEFVEAQAAKIVYATSESATSSLVKLVMNTGNKINGDAQPFVRVEYYLYGAEDDSIAFYPQIVINGATYTATQKAKLGWNVATFMINGAGDFKEFAFLPYGEYSDVKDTNKLYLSTISFSHYQNENGISYAEPKLTQKGDYIPVLDDLVMTSAELVNTAGLKNVTSTDVPFVAGSAIKYTPKATKGVEVDYYLLSNGSIVPVNGEFLPYVRVEYYIYARETDEITTAYPQLVIGDKVFTAPQALVYNEWAVATFNIVEVADEFKSIKFLPYGDAEGLNEWNKMYIQQVIFSQTENTEVAVYAKPEMTENGEVVPYIFDPAAKGLEVLPVVYYTDGGVYSGAAEGSTSSLAAYGSFSQAVTALNAAGGGYLILTSDVKFGEIPSSNSTHCHREIPVTANQFPGHANMIIIRGMEKKDGTKINVNVAGQPGIGGPTSFQNLNYVGMSAGDTGFQIHGYDFEWGTPGGADDDVTNIKYCETCAIPFVVLGGDGGITNKNISATFYSGKYNGGLRTTGGFNKITADSGEYIFKGGDFTNMTWKNGHFNASTVNGNYKVVIEGGKWKNAMNFADCAYVGGNLDVIISGKPDFSAASGKIFTAAKAASSSAKGFAGTRTIDILGYEGDFEAFKSMIDYNSFDVLNINSVFLATNGTGNGSSPSSPVGTLEDAIKGCTKEESGKIYGGRIVIAGNGFVVEGDMAEMSNNATHSNTILYTSINNAPLTFEGGNLILCGPARFTNITFKSGNADSGAIVANGYAVEFSESCSGVAYEGEYVDVIGGKLDGVVGTANVTINGGSFGDVLAGGSVEGDVTITINGGTINGKVVGGSSAVEGVIGGNATIVINDGKFKGDIIGGNDASGAVIEGVVNVDINGGKFSADTTILATNSTATSTVTGNAEINISGGDFSAMADGQIQPGSGTCGDKICLDYESYKGSAATLKNKASTTFDVIIELKQDAPVFTEADRFIFIIQHYGDPTKALTKSIPFKITQSAAQTSAPVVVAPKQLNIKMDGTEHAKLSIQTVKDTCETIRIIPNHNPSKGAAIVLDGYNINGRGVDVAKYKYIEIVYYYTVPEGETPAVQNMYFRPLSDHSSCPAQTTGTLVANKWATALIDMTASFEGKTGNLKQYHFHPMGNGKKGPDVPANQYLDIASLTFYTDKPNTTIQGGNVPNAKVEAEEAAKAEQAAAAKKPVTINDIVVSVVNLKSTVDNSGAFTSASVSKDGMTVMEYTPNISSDKEVRIEGYNCMGKAISLNEYQYLTMKILVETERTDVTFKPTVAVCQGGVADNPEKAKTTTITSDKALVPNQWTTVTLKIAPADPNYHITRQFHIAPAGFVKGNAFKEGEKIYLAEFVLSNQPPKTKTEGGAAGEEVVEVELEVIEESPAVVVEGAKLINSAGNFATFKSTIGQFDGKNVVVIKPNKVEAPVTIDGAGIFGKSEQTPDGALSLKKHRYAVISYYYATTSDAERIPEFDLLGGRIQNKGDVVNGNTAKGTAGLVKNEWATAVVKLSGNGTGVLTSGFNFRPFGDTDGASLNAGDVLYIENITFVSNRP